MSELSVGYNLFIANNCTHSYLTMVYVIILDTVIVNLFEHAYDGLWKKGTGCHQYMVKKTVHMGGTRRSESTSFWLHTCETSIQKQCEELQTLPGAEIDSDHSLLVAKICTRLKKIIRFQKRRSQRDLEKLCAQRQRVQDTVEEKLCAIGCEYWNVEVEWNNIKRCVC
jgi:hypothetical protein